ncbi:putative transport protein/permeases of the major facilitator superfamily [Thermoproteus uzoniensis 768-20]|uniref:Transport protein/permeases of the major facilitator superfamily n=1 Tax=Thermoproteus uzoniensis (strain 768-20) TaxID=999630 RepID=F2L5Q7_THEU7|nr:MFS transporter [Thermoproteus uzoniensis]AEA13603.1 putative transport protein/permeases of the major facilitator superfamily [Thermoproteus uzoniensis 768-20]
MAQTELNDAIKVAISANLGWGFELYDLIAYIYAAPYIATQFFPKTDYVASLLETLLLLVLGYFARPLGAILWGHIGDKMGRKITWFVVLLGMGLVTVAIGFLPTYAQIGVAAAALLVLFRILQGIFLGGEWAGGLTITAEFAPPNMRGLLGGVAQGGAGLASVFAAAAVALATVFAPTKDAMMAYGWRILFWFGAVPLAIALFVRWKIRESEIWLKKGKPAVERIPFLALLRRYWLFVIIATLVIFGESLIYYGSIGYFGTLLPLLGYGREGVILASLSAGLTWMLLGPLFGHLSDRLGKRKSILATYYAIAALTLYPIWILIAGGQLANLVIGAALMGMVFSSQYSVLPAWLAETIETKVRFSGIGFILNLGVAFSSFAPYISTYLLKSIGQTYGTVTAISLVTIIGALIALVFVLLSRDRCCQELL